MWWLLRTILFFLTFTLAFSQDPETFFTTGEAQLSSGDLAGAESSFNAALKSDPSFAPAYQGLSKLSGSLSSGNALQRSRMASSTVKMGSNPSIFLILSEVTR